MELALPRIAKAGKHQRVDGQLVWSVLVAGLAAGVAAALAGPALAVAATAAGHTVITRADLRERRIPRGAVHATAIGVAAALLLAAATLGAWGRLASAGLFAAGAAALCTLAWLVGAVGFGDVRLAFMVTMTAGWHGLDVVVALWWWTSVAALMGAIAARGRADKHAPLAPAIALGWALAVLPAG